MWKRRDRGDQSLSQGLGEVTQVGEDGGGERISSMPRSNLPHAGYWPHSLGVNRSTKSHTVSREPGSSEPIAGERLATGNEGVGLQEAVGRVRR